MHIIIMSYCHVVMVLTGPLSAKSLTNNCKPTHKKRHAATISKSTSRTCDAGCVLLCRFKRFNPKDFYYSPQVGPILGRRTSAMLSCFVFKQTNEEATRPTDCGWSIVDSQDVTCLNNSFTILSIELLLGKI